MANFQQKINSYGELSTDIKTQQETNQLKDYVGWFVKLG